MRRENSQLEREIQRLKRKLQVLHELYQEHILPPPRTLFGEETHGNREETVQPAQNGRASWQIRGLCEKMAKDVCKESERNTCCRVQGTLFREKRARKAGTVLTKRKLEELRRYGDCDRHLLANIRSNCQPCPSGPSVPAAPAAARRARKCQGAPWVDGPPRNEEDHTVRTRGSEASCRFDSAHSTGGFEN